MPPFFRGEQQWYVNNVVVNASLKWVGRCLTFATLQSVSENMTKRVAMSDRQITHAPGCWGWSPKHYECALAKENKA